MKHSNKIVSSYACSAVERFFFVKGPDKKCIVNKDALSKFIVNILEPVCELLKMQQNLYGIKTLYRVIQTAGSDIIIYAPTLAQMFEIFIDTMIAQSGNQTFNYWLFECIGLSLKIGKDSDSTIAAYEEKITNSMFNIISKNIPELISYAFQILSMFVLYRKDVQPNYQVLLNSIISSGSNWDQNMRYLIPGMIQYARAYIIKNQSEMVNQIKVLTDIFEKVLNLRIDDSAFALLNTLFTVFGPGILKDSFTTIFVAIFRRIQHDKTSTVLKQVPPPFSKGVLLFISLFINISGLDALRKCTDQIQNGILLMLLNSESDRLKSVEGFRQRREVLAAFSKILLEIPDLPQDLFKKILEGNIMLGCSGVRRGLGDFESEDNGQDNMQRMKYQQLYTATIEVNTFIINIY